MSVLRQVREWFDGKFGGSADSPTPRYILTGGLCAVILVCCIMTARSLLSAGRGGGGAAEAGERHFWCVETKQEVILKPGQVPEEEAAMADADPGLMINLLLHAISHLPCTRACTCACTYGRPAESIAVISWQDAGRVWRRRVVRTLWRGAR